MQRLARVLRNRVAKNRHAAGLRIDLEVDQVSAATRAGALAVEAPVAADRAAGLAGDLREVGNRHRLELLGRGAQRLHVALRELDLVGLELPELGRARTELGLDLLGGL